MNFSYQGRHPPAQLAAMAARSHANVDQTWYVDSGANNHITSDLSNLEVSEPYQGDNDVTVGNGTGLYISHTGFSTFQTTSNSNYPIFFIAQRLPLIFYPSKDFVRIITAGLS